MKMLPFVILMVVSIQLNAEEKVQWTCPMHPQIILNEPGNCPICGMTLVKRIVKKPKENPKPSQNKIKSESTIKDDAPTHQNLYAMPANHVPIQLSFDRQQMIGIKLTKVEKGELTKTIYAAGKIAFDPDLYAAQNEYVLANKQLKELKSASPEALRSARQMIDAAQLRLKILGLSDEQIEKLSKSKKIDQGLLLSKSSDKKWIYAEVFEIDIPYIKSDSKATITAPFLQGHSLYGKVVAIDSVIDVATRTATARIIVDNPSVELRAENIVDVAFEINLGEQVFVPFDAVMDTGLQSWVFIAGKDGSFEPRLISIAFYANDKVAVAKGLSGGETIVSKANFLIDSESRIQASAQAAAENTLPKCPDGEYWHAEMNHCMPLTKANP